MDRILQGPLMASDNRILNSPRWCFLTWILTSPSWPLMALTRIVHFTSQNPPAPWIALNHQFGPRWSIFPPGGLTPRLHRAGKSAPIAKEFSVKSSGGPLDAKRNPEMDGILVVWNWLNRLNWFRLQNLSRSLRPPLTEGPADLIMFYWNRFISIHFDHI